MKTGTESNIKNVLKEHVQTRHPSVSFQQVWGLHLNQTPHTSIQRTRKAWIPAGVAAMIMFALLLNPTVRASMNSFIHTTIIKHKEEATIYSGWVSSRKWDAATTYPSVQDAERKLGTKIPFPQQLLAKEHGALNHELVVTTEKGDVVGYGYSLRTTDRILSVTANYKSTRSPHINVETTKPVVDKQVDIHGIPARLIAVHEFDGYTMYLEKEDWKIIIQGTAEGSPEKPRASQFTETEALELARSILW